MHLISLARDIITLQSQSILSWKKTGVQLHHENFLRIVEENHAFNYQLWHAEDRARRDDQGYEFVYTAKREIDQHNQQRNDRMEKMDMWLYQFLQPAQISTCPMHSETPGMIIDRLSILALKVYHMQAQTTRIDVNNEHRLSCQAKLNILNQQLAHLETCLHTFLHEVKHQQRTFRLYHQLKMYNDPTLNPELYQQEAEPSL